MNIPDKMTHKQGLCIIAFCLWFWFATALAVIELIEWAQP